ncbi:uncharacterized protein TNCT_582951 [Trichonephila clavata]|uniref:Uncharacterized protein n=1 Tax=Trichonephila clavata TaxID=2740835 RepID=A0A8X6FKR8_TRICU|nr:uncharacterized protein TNCT_582951 [Trichonephila clavata]
MARGSANNMVGSKNRARKSSQVKENEVKKVPCSIPKSTNGRKEKAPATAKKIVKKSTVKKINVQKKGNKEIKTGNKNEKKVPVKRNKKEEDSVEIGKRERVSHKRKVEDLLEENYVSENIVKGKSISREPNKKRTKYDSNENKNDVKKITSKSSENEIIVKVESVKTSSRKTRNLRMAVGDSKLYDDSQKKEYTKLKGAKMDANLKKTLARGKEAIKNSESQNLTTTKSTINTKVNVRKTRNAKKVIDTKNIEVNNQTDKIKDLITAPLAKDIIKYEKVDPSQMDDYIKVGKKITVNKSVTRTKKNSHLESSGRKTRNAIKLQVTDIDKVSKIVTKSTLGSKETKNCTEVINITSKAEIKGNKSEEKGSKTWKAKKSEETKTDVKSSKNDIDVTKTKNETIKVIQDTGSHKTKTAKRFGNKSSAKDTFEQDIDGIVEKKIANKQTILKNEMDSAEIIVFKKTKRGMKTMTENAKVSEEMQNLKKSKASNNTPGADEISELEKYKKSKTKSGAAIEQNPKLVIEQNSKLVEFENETKENEGRKTVESSIDSTENANLKIGSRKNKKKMTLGKSQKNPIKNEGEINIKSDLEVSKEVSGENANIPENENYCKTNQDLEENEAILVNEEASQNSPKRAESEHSDKNIPEIKTEFIEKILKNKLNQDEIEHHREAELIISNDMDVEKHPEENKDNSDEDVRMNETEVKQKILEMKGSAGILCQTNIQNRFPKTFKSDCELEINELKREEIEFGTEIICKMSIESTSKINKITEDANIENSKKFLYKDEFSEKHIDRNCNEQEEGKGSPERTSKLTDVEVNDSVSNTNMKKIKKDHKSTGTKNSMEITGIINVKENLKTIIKTNNSEEYSKTNLESFDAESNSWKHFEMQNVLEDVSEKDLNTNGIQNSCCLVDATFRRKNCEIEENSDVLNNEVVLDKNDFVAKNTEIHAEIKEIEYKDSSKYNKQDSNTTKAEAVNEASNSRTVEICCTDVETKKFETLEHIVKEVEYNEMLEPDKTNNGNINISQVNLQNSKTMNELEVQNSKAMNELEVKNSKTMNELEAEVQNSKTVNELEVKVRNSEAGDELEVEVGNSKALCELQNSEAEVEVQNSEAEVEVQNSEAEAEVQNSEAEVEVRNSGAEVEVRNSEAEVEVWNSEAEVEVRNSEAEVEVRNSEAEVEVRNSEAEVEVRNSEAEVVAEDSKIAVEAEDSEAAVEAEDSEAAVEAEDSEAAVEAEDSEAAVEAEDSEAAVEAEDSEAVVEAEDSEAVVEAEDSEAVVEAEDSEAVVEAEDSEAAVEAEDSEAAVEAEDSEVVVEAENVAVVEAENSEAVVEAENSEAVVEAENYVALVGAENSVALVEAEDSEAVVEAENSEAVVEAENSEAVVEAENSEAVVEAENSEAVVEAENYVALVGAKNSVALVGAENSVALVEAENSVALVEAENSVALVEAENSVALVEAENSVALVEAENSVALVEAENSVALVEAENSVALFEAENSVALVEAENSVALVEAENSVAVVEAENSETGVEADNTESVVKLQNSKTDVESQNYKNLTEFEINKSGNIQNNLNCSYGTINILSNKEKTLTGGTSSKNKESIELDVENVTNFKEKNKIFQNRMESVDVEMKTLNVALKTQEEENFQSEALKQFLPDCEVKSENSKNMSKVEYHSTEKIMVESSNVENESCSSSSRMRNALGISNNQFDEKIENNKEYTFENKTIKSCNDNKPKKIFLSETHENGQLIGKNSLQCDKPLEETSFTNKKLLEENSNSSKHLSETFDDCNECLEIMPCNVYKNIVSDNKGKSVEVMKEISVQDITKVKDYDNENCLQIKNVNDNKHVGEISACRTKQLNILSAHIDEQKQINVINRIKRLDEPSNDRDLSKETLAYSEEQMLGTFQNGRKQSKENISNDSHELIEISFDKKKVLNVTNSESIQLNEVAQQFNKEVTITKSDICEENELKNSDNIVNDTNVNDLNKETENAKLKMSETPELNNGSSIASTNCAPEDKEVSNESFPDENKELVNYTNKKKSCTELPILSEANSTPVMPLEKSVIYKELDAKLQSKRSTCDLGVSKREKCSEILIPAESKELCLNSELLNENKETIHKTSPNFESSNTVLVQQKNLDYGTISIVKKEGNRKKTRVVKTNGDFKQMSDEEIRKCCVNPELFESNNSTNGKKAIKRKSENLPSQTEPGSSTEVSVEIKIKKKPNPNDPKKCAVQHMDRLLLGKEWKTSNCIEIERSQNRIIDPSEPGPSWLESAAELASRKRKAPSTPTPSTSNEIKRLCVRNSSAPVRMYLEQFVPFLLEGLLKVTYVRPNDPIQYLADWMKANKTAAYERMNS